MKNCADQSNLLDHVAVTNEDSNLLSLREHHVRKS